MTYGAGYYRTGSFELAAVDGGLSGVFELAQRRVAALDTAREVMPRAATRRRASWEATWIGTRQSWANSLCDLSHDQRLIDIMLKDGAEGVAADWRRSNGNLFSGDVQSFSMVVAQESIAQAFAPLALFQVFARATSSTDRQRHASLAGSHHKALESLCTRDNENRGSRSSARLALRAAIAAHDAGRLLDWEGLRLSDLAELQRVAPPRFEIIVECLRILAEQPSSVVQDTHDWLDILGRAELPDDVALVACWYGFSTALRATIWQTADQAIKRLGYPPSFDGVRVSAQAYHEALVLRSGELNRNGRTFNEWRNSRARRLERDLQDMGCDQRTVDDALRVIGELYQIPRLFT